MQITERLKQTIISPRTELKHTNEMELAVAVMLSAQTTDKKVNEVTESLFKKYQSWSDFSHADLKTLQGDIRGVNFHLGKADRIIKASKMILKEFNGFLPRTISELIRIPGVARKSANVILQELWDIAEGIVVDTHISRVSNRLGLTVEKDPVKIERDLMLLFPRDSWRYLSGAMVMHGRYVCKARKPNCRDCVLSEICPSSGLF